MSVYTPISIPATTLSTSSVATTLVCLAPPGKTLLVERVSFTYTAPTNYGAVSVYLLLKESGKATTQKLREFQNVTSANAPRTYSNFLVLSPGDSLRAYTTKPAGLPIGSTITTFVTAMGDAIEIV